MTREVSFVFHVGFAKTATSTIQSKLATLPNVLFLGKGIHDNAKGFRVEIDDIHLKLFKSFRMEAVIGFANPSRSSAALLNKYAEAIVDLTIDAEKEIIVLSDECIGDYFNYIGEWNIFLIIALANMVEERLNAEGYKVKKNLSFTIRRQLDVIKSVIGYLPTIMTSSVDGLLDSYYENFEEGILGSYYYFSNISLFESVTNNDWSIQVVPYEFLADTGRTDLYLNRILNAKLLQADVDNKIANSNSSINPSSGVRDQILKSRNFLGSLGFRLMTEGSAININATQKGLKVTKYFAVGLYFLGKILKWIGGFQKRVVNSLRRNQKSYVHCSKHAEERITKLYRKDNKLLKRYIDEDELRKFGYIEQL